MQRSRFFSIAAIIALLCASATLLYAQDIALTDRGPRFLWVSDNGKAATDASSAEQLHRRVSMDVLSGTLDDALKEIARQANLELIYSHALVPAERRVTLQANDITVAAALTEILLGAGVDVVLLETGHVGLVRKNRGPGAIVGTVTDASSGRPLTSAHVWIEGTRHNTLTDGEGRYSFPNMEPGAYTIIASLIGYRRATQGVPVVADQTVTTDFALDVSPTTLTELVVTATGEQRRLELGHDVGRINADSIVKAAPVSSVSELLNGRVAGLHVQTFQGTVGGEVSLQIRSPNSIQLGTTPLVIVDGVRYTSAAADRISLSSINRVEPTSPLNDLNPNDIESIEVVKGPSASTLYGTDAANGVIVISTKRGRAGPARWSAYTRAAVTEIPKIHYPEAYWGWRTIRGNPSLTGFCTLDGVARGNCSQDSVTVISNLLNDPERTIFASKPRWEYGANVSGGSRDVRYFFAADLEQATGPLRMPPNVADSISGIRGILQEQLEPNTLTKVNFRSNIAVELGQSADLQVNAGYTHRAARTLAGGNPYVSALSPSPAEPDGFAPPQQNFSQTSSERVSRAFASLTARWSPTSWLSARGLGGIDLSSIARSSLTRRDESPRFFRLGAVSDDRGRQLAATAEVAASASFSSGRLTYRTSLGAQYVRTVDDLIGSAGTDLPPGASTIGAAASVQTRHSYREQATLGSYLEQMVGLNQRLFLTGALRMDGASTFGNNYDAATYPKAGVSWLVSEEPMLPRLPFLDEFRLRYAFGASGQQPRPEWARPGYMVAQRLVDGVTSSVYTVTGLGNPNLRPERVSEHEFGFDASAVDHRVDLGLTWYRRATVDQIVSVALPPGLATVQTNLGRTTGHGFEAQLTVRPIDSRFVTWMLTLQHSFHRTTLRELGGAVEQRSRYGGWVEGYPLGARFTRPLLGYADANGDGFISQSEVQLGDTLVYAGESTPPRAQTLATSVGFLEGRIRLSALVERRSGFSQLNGLLENQCINNRCRGLIDPTAPLADQADAVAKTVRSDHAFIEPGDFTRLREVGVAVDLPNAVIRALRLGSATLALQARNLALWTSYRGVDPESASLGSDVQEIGIPQGRTWALRFDIGF